MVRRLFLSVFIAFVSAAAQDSLSSPDVPANLVVLKLSPTSLDLKWADSSRFEANYIVQRSTNLLSWTSLGVVPANTTHVTAANLSPNTTYFFRVRVRAADGSIKDGPMTVAKTGLHIISTDQIGSSGAHLQPNDIACSSDGGCVIYGRVQGQITQCGTTLQDTGFLIKLSPSRECIWAVPVDETLEVADIAIAQSGDVAITGTRLILDPIKDIDVTELVVQRISGQTGALLWTAEKIAANSDGTLQDWWGSAATFDIAGADIYVAGSRTETNAQGVIAYKGILEKFSSTSGVNTQVAEITGTSNIGADARKNAGFYDVIVRSDGVIVATGSRSYEQQSGSVYTYREDLVVRIAATNHVFAAPTGTFINGESVVENPLDHSVYILANSSEPGIATKIYRLSTSGAVIAGFPRTFAGTAIPTFSGADAGIDSGGELLVAVNSQILKLSPEGLLRYTTAQDGSPHSGSIFAGSMAGNSMIGLAILSPGSTWFQWMERRPLGLRDIGIAKYSAVSPAPTEHVGPTVASFSARCVLADCSDNRVAVSIQATDDKPLNRIGGMRFSFGDLGWLPVQDYSTETILTVPVKVSLPTIVRVQIRDTDMNWSQAGAAKVGSPLINSEPVLDSGAAKPINVAAD